MTFPSDTAENVTYTYDQSGHGSGIRRLTSVADAAGTLSRSYDEFGNLLTDVRTTSAASLATAYSYDAANRIASITYPSGAVVSYTRDTMGRITGVTAKPSGGTSQAVVSSIAYEPFGPYTGLTYGNGVAEARGFDQDYRLTTLTDTGSSPLQNLTYAYYPTNNVKPITDAVNAGNSQSFVYDNLQRLTQAAGGYGTYGYSYDNDGNRLTQTLGGVTTNYGIGAGNDLLSTISMGGVTTQTIGYTADGRMASFNPGIQSPGGQYIISLSYNEDAQLSAVNASGGALASYTYDGFGQRLLKTFSSTSGQIYQYGQNGMLLEETDQSGAAQADYIYLDGRPIATLNPSLGTLFYLHDDMLGTPQVATDGSQSTAWQSTYRPFGQASVSGTVTQNLRFPGQYFDLESGWNHNGFRDYIPDLGRYTQPDPLAMQGSANFYSPQNGRLAPIGLPRDNRGGSIYSYALNDPATFVDPSGAIICPSFLPWCSQNNSVTSTSSGVGIGPYLKFPFDPMNYVPTHGNWCGPNWSGGWNPTLHNGVDGSAPPVDALDRLCKQHDKMYEKAKNQCDIHKADVWLGNHAAELPSDPSYNRYKNLLLNVFPPSYPPLTGEQQAMQLYYQNQYSQWLGTAH